MKKHLTDLFRLWLREYFKHPLENIRQANPIVPKRLYYNFGNVCKAVPYTAHEKAYIESYRTADNISVSPETMIELVKALNGNREAVMAMQQEMAQNQLPPRCSICDFHKSGIPCPIHNLLKNGSTVCDTHRYIIIKHAV